MPVLGRSSGELTTKIYTLIDALGNPTHFILTSGEKHDLVGAGYLLKKHYEEKVSDLQITLLLYAGTFQ